MRETVRPYMNNLPESVPLDHAPYSDKQTYYAVRWSDFPGQFFVLPIEVHRGEEQRLMFWRGLNFLRESDAITQAAKLNTALSSVLPDYHDYKGE